MAKAPATGYSGTPLAKKLGIKEDMLICALGAPEDYQKLLGQLPKSVEFTNTISSRTDVVHFFTSRESSLRKELPRFRKTLKPDAVIWVSWPKRASKVPTDVTEDVIRSLALPLGFVDVKVCAVDEIWSGLKLVVRTSLRG